MGVTVREEGVENFGEGSSLYDIFEILHAGGKFLVDSMPDACIFAFAVNNHAIEVEKETDGIGIDTACCHIYTACLYMLFLT